MDVMQSDKQTGIYVIIPVYNGRDFLKTAVASVLAQDYKQIEIFLIDDGSTDGSADLCDELAGNSGNIHVIHQKNAGVSAARNTGIEAVLALTEENGTQDSSYIAFLDQDDSWQAGTIRDDSISGSFDMIGFSSVYSNMKGDRFRICHTYDNRTISIPDRGMVEWIWGGHMGSHLYRTDFLKKFRLRFTVGCIYCQDVIFIRQAVFCAAGFKTISDFLYIYRTNTDSVTHHHSKDIEDALLIPKDWRSVKDWSDQYEDDFSGEKREAWRKSCEAYVGARILEAAGILIEYGFTYDEIMQVIKEDGFLVYLDQLRENELADWQKPDLAMLRGDKEQFIKTHISAGRRRRFLEKVRAMFPFLIPVYEKKRYPLNKVPS